MGTAEQVLAIAAAAGFDDCIDAGFDHGVADQRGGGAKAPGVDIRIEGHGDHAASRPRRRALRRW